MTLTSVSDRLCIQCHTDLKTLGASFQIVAENGRRISGFGSGHPEFAITVKREQGSARVGLNADELRDQAEIKLNHQVHLKPDLFGPEKQRLQMKCSDCHQPDDRGAYMRPINYEQHCMACHLLEFDGRFQTAQRDTEAVLKAYEQRRSAEYITAHPDQFPVVPHDRPEAIRSFLQEKYSDYVLKQPQQTIRQEIELVGRLPRQARYRQLPVSARQWVDQQVQTAETLLFRKACRECHEMELADGRLPVVVAPNVPARWLVHSVFDHKAHQALACVACHQRASESRLTSDVLLPGIASCQSCHNPSAGGRLSQCSTCHTYHDKSKSRDLNGPFTLRDLAPR
jgi:hypothetical protein